MKSAGSFFRYPFHYPRSSHYLYSQNRQHAERPRLCINKPTREYAAYIPYGYTMGIYTTKPGRVLIYLTVSIYLVALSGTVFVKLRSLRIATDKR